MRRLLMKYLLVFLLASMLLSACNGSKSVQTKNPSYPNEPSYPNASETGTPAPQPYAPQPGDDALTRGGVFLDSAEISVLESYPVQIMLTLKGSLPTPCNQLRVKTNPPDEKNQIQVEVYSVIDETQICAQVLEPFGVNIGLGSFLAGHYSVWVNGKKIGEFDS
jgi:hypothetical protein